MLFSYHAIDKDGRERDGTIEAVSQDLAVSALQRRDLVVSAIGPAETKSWTQIEIFSRVSSKDVVILSRQIATLFGAQVSALRVFRLLAAEVDNPKLASILSSVGDEIQGGSPISKALSRHPKVFSSFYVNMVRAGEESGKLSETFDYLATYLDRSYEVMSKAQNALTYPIFVIVVFFSVMWLMLALVIPKISAILADSDQTVPLLTSIVIGISDFLAHYSIFILAVLIALGAYMWQLSRTKRGKLIIDGLKLSIPYVGTLYSKLYLARIADNFATMLLSGISVVEALEITSTIVDNATYQAILADVAAKVRGGASISDSLGAHPEIPGIMVAMTRVGEETGELGSILGTLAKFYNREVTNAVDTLVGLIEPTMIVLLALGVGILLAAVLVPIYNLAGAF